MTVRWGDEHSAKTAPIGAVLYDDDDDLFTVKARDNEWLVYHPVIDKSLDDYDIDHDRGDQIVGQLE